MYESGTGGTLNGTVLGMKIETRMCDLKAARRLHCLFKTQRKSSMFWKKKNRSLAFAK